MKHVRMLGAVTAVALLLTGCARPTTSAERHAREFVSQSADDFDPNFRTHIYNSVKASTPFFQQFYDMGKKDKAGGMSLAEKEQRVKYFGSDAFFNMLKPTSTYAGHNYDIKKDEKFRNAMTQAIINTYRDGYDGR